MGLFENQYNKLREYRDKINYCISEVIENKNSIKILFDKRVNF